MARRRRRRPATSPDAYLRQRPRRRRRVAAPRHTVARYQREPVAFRNARLKGARRRAASGRTDVIDRTVLRGARRRQRVRQLRSESPAIRDARERGAIRRKARGDLSPLDRQVLEEAGRRSAARKLAQEPAGIRRARVLGALRRSRQGRSKRKDAFVLEESVKRAQRARERREKKDDDKGLLDTALGAVGFVARGGRGKSDGKSRGTSVGATVGVPTPSIGEVGRVASLVGAEHGRDPLGMLKKDVRGARDAAFGLAQSAGEAATTIARDIDQPWKLPVSAGKAALKMAGEQAADWERRYGKLGTPEGDKAFRERIRKEGAFAEIVDAAALGSAGAGVIGRPAAALARRAPAGSKLKRATEPRRRLRYSAGERGTKFQRRSPNLIVGLMQEGKDTRRADKHARRVAQGRDRRGLPQREGEVVAPKWRTSNKMIGLLPRVQGEAKAHARIEMLGEQNRILREAKEGERRLNGKERRVLKFAVQLGLPADKGKAREILERYRALVVETRSKPNAEQPALLHGDRQDALKQIDRILEDIDGHMTPRVREVADQWRDLEARTSVEDPRLDPIQAERRRVAPVAKLLGIDPPETTAMKRETAKGEVDEARKVLGIAGRERTRARTAATKMGYAERRLEKRGARIMPPDPKTLERERKQGQALLDDPEFGTPDMRARLRQRVEVELPDLIERARAAPPVREARREQHRAVREEAKAVESRDRERVAQKRAELKSATLRRRELEAQLPRVPQGDRRRSAEARVREAKAEENFLRARVDYDNAVQKLRDLGPNTKPTALEEIAAYIEKVKAAAIEAGMEAPAYWESRQRPVTFASLRAVGGRRAVRDSHVWTGHTFTHGLEDWDPQVFLDGLARNIKVKHNWNFVARSVERHAFDWSRGQDGGGMLLRDIKKRLDEDEIAESEVEYWSAGRFYEQQREAYLGVESDRMETDFGEFDAQSMRQVNKAFSDARLLTMPSDFTSQAINRYFVVPKAAMDEIDSATKPGTAGGRIWEKVWRNFPSRIILGLFNVPWQVFQPISNAGLALLAGAWNPIHWARAEIWWRRLSQEQRDAVEPHVGIGHFNADAKARNLGGASNSEFINGYRAFKQAFGDMPLSPRVRGRRARMRDINPLDAAFRIDEGQNNYFRRQVLYNQARKMAWRRMGENLTAMQRLQNRIVAIMGKPPEAQMREIISNRELMEEHAAHVNDFLGDYQTFTHWERIVLQRNVMFYGYLRFSLRFAFYTMPVRHPLMTSLLAMAGAEGARDIRELIGAQAGEVVPSYVMGKYMRRTGDVLTSMPLGKANPTMNALTQATGPNAIVGLFPPWLGIVADQVGMRSTFKNRQWKAGLMPERKEEIGYSVFNANRPGGIGDFERPRIALRSVLSMAMPYRLWEEANRPTTGPPGDDTLAWDPRATLFADPKTVKNIKKTEKERHRGLDAVIRGLHPFASEPDISEEMAGRTREKKAEFRTQAARRKSGTHAERARRRRRRKVDPYAPTPRQRDAYGGGGSYGSGGGGY